METIKEGFDEGTPKGWLKLSLGEDLGSPVEDSDLSIRTSPQMFSCEFCPMDFFSTEALHGHQNAHRAERYERERLKLSLGADYKMFPCKYCPKTFGSVKALAGHQNVHRTEWVGIKRIKMEDMIYLQAHSFVLIKPSREGILATRSCESDKAVWVTEENPWKKYVIQKLDLNK